MPLCLRLIMKGVERMLTVSGSAQSKEAEKPKPQESKSLTVVIPRKLYDGSCTKNLYQRDRAAYYDYMQNVVEHFIEFGA